MRRPLVRQSWRQMTFLHWRMDPDCLQALLPTGLVPDIVEGSAWIGLTPFRIERFRVADAPPIPRLSSFPETNLRTYVRAPDGSDGLWFLSLDVTSLGNTLGGRLAGVPYFWSAMSVEEQDDDEDQVRYRCRRRSGRPAHHDIVVKPGRRVDPESPLAATLAGRWRSFSRVGGRLLEIPVEHQPWPLRHADLLHLDETLLASGGLPRPSGEPLVHYSDGVDARLGPPRLVGHRDAPTR